MSNSVVVVEIVTCGHAGGARAPGQVGARPPWSRDLVGYHEDARRFVALSLTQSARDGRVRGSERDELLVTAVAEWAHARAPVRLRKGVAALGAGIDVGGKIAGGERGSGGGEDVESETRTRSAGELVQEGAQEW